MAINQPLASSLHDVSDDALTGMTNIHGPTVRRVHAALDECAAESGPMRFEKALRVEFPEGVGSAWLLRDPPSSGLSDLFVAAPGAKDAFGDVLALPVKGEVPRGRLTVTGGGIEESGHEVPMSVFLAMLDRDPQTTPSSLERLFDEMETASRAGLVEMTASTIALTPAGRRMVAEAGSVLTAVSEESIAVIDLYAQEVADGRMTLREAIDATGRDLGLALPAPGEEIQDETFDGVGSSVRGAADELRFLVEAAKDIPEALRLHVIVFVLSEALVNVGVAEAHAEDRVRNDLRLLRLFGGSLSHGLPSVKDARRQLLPEHEIMVDFFRNRLSGNVVNAFVLERVIPVEEGCQEETEMSEPRRRRRWLWHLLARLGIRV